MTLRLCASLSLCAVVVGVAPYDGLRNRAEPSPVRGNEHRGVVEDGRNTAPATDLLPKCPAKRTATKALRGDWGTLPRWKKVGYTRLLEQGTTKQTAWLTNYWTGEPGVGTVCASGRSVEAGRTAAMLHSSGRRLRSGEFGGFVLLELPEGMELRQVWDTGSPANAGRAARRGAQTWLDRFVTRRDGRTWIAPVYVVRGADGDE
jgi:hypothetical protein